MKTERLGGSRRWFYFIPATGEPVKVVHAIEPEQIDVLPGKKLIYREWSLLKSQVKTRDRSREAASRCSTRRVTTSRTSLASMPERSRWCEVSALRSPSSADLVQQFEAVWTDDQLAMHKEGAEKMQKIILETFAEIKRRTLANEPTTEIDVQQFMMKKYTEVGMRSSPMIVAVNANAASPHYFPTKERNSPIKRGDLVLIDAVSKMDKPRAPAVDLTWMGYVGETVPKEYSDVWNIVYGAQQAAFDFVKKSFQTGKLIRGADVDDVSRGVIRKAGYADEFLHRTGHSIGEEGHGNGANIDNLETRDSRRLIPRTAFSIEPGIYLAGKFGIRSEIDVYVTENDAIITAPHQTEILAIMK